MAGVKGRSGGQNRKSVEELKLTGAYKPVRHDGIIVAPENREKAEIANFLTTSRFAIDNKQIFEQFSTYLFDAGMTQSVDTVMLNQLVMSYEIYLRATKVFRTDGIDAKVGMKLAVTLMEEQAKIIRIILAEFRLTPSTRGLSTDGTGAVVDDPVANFVNIVLTNK